MVGGALRSKGAQVCGWMSKPGTSTAAPCAVGWKHLLLPTLISGKKTLGECCGQLLPVWVDDPQSSALAGSGVATLKAKITKATLAITPGNARIASSSRRTLYRKLYAALS